ncbi:MAG: DUF4440 domain-containing protein [Candidatus Kariarchaeaceae archaeon]|jgi:calcium/calmodulin-dependent protein kinase (CaM kinase) II
MDSETQELHDSLIKLLHSIKSSDWESYVTLTSEELTCFEPETHGHPVDGLPFHKFFFDNPSSKSPYHIELVKPIFRIYGDVAYTTYTLLTSRMDAGKANVSRANETRIFQKIEGNWKMVHFHRS